MVRRHEQTETLRLPWGGKIQVNCAKQMGQSLLRTGIYDLAMSEFLWRMIGPSDQVMDIGANIGYTTLLMARRVGPKGTVLAFEPHPDLFKQLNFNVSQFCQSNICGRVELTQCAVSSKSGVATLECSNGFEVNDGIARIVDNSRGAINPIQVKSVTLDEITRGRGNYSVLKIDVEGHELSVLKGANRLLQSNVRHILFEDHEGAQSRVCNCLRELGFQLFGLGWSMRRLVIFPVYRELPSRQYEAPNFVATRCPDQMFSACHETGWRVLQKQ
jgi:FkbM family methyltransferase